MGKQGPRSPVGNQVGIQKSAFRTRSDSNGIDPGMNNGSTAQIHGAGIHPNETTETIKKRPNLLVEVKAETYYGIRTKF